jgi:hypothetical protein
MVFVFNTALGPRTINTNYEVCYLAGYSEDGKTIYIDKRLPRYLELKDGRKLDIYIPLITHESWEYALEHGLVETTPEQQKIFNDWVKQKHLKKHSGYQYPFAHEQATGKEREWVESNGFDWDEYQNYMLKEVEKLNTFTESPPDLDTKPEKDTHDYYRYHKIEELKKKAKKNMQAQKIIANEQSYQSIYINPYADNWQEVIVFHEPIFDDEIPGVIALKSLRLEKCLGFVLAAPKSRLRYFREKIKDFDSKESLGKKQPREILKQLLLLSEEIGGTVVYIQNEYIEEPKENLKGIKAPEKKKKDPKRVESPKSKQQQEADSFFDPLTKRQLVTKGPQYFDPSLPSMNKVVDKVDAASMLFSCSASLQRIYSPSTENYPEDLSMSNLPIWQRVSAKFKTFEVEDTLSRWQLVRSHYEKKCADLEIAPYKLLSLGNDVEIKESIQNNIGFAFRMLQHILPQQSEPTQIRLRIIDAIVGDEDIKVICQTSVKSAKSAVANIFENHGFKYAVVGSKKNLTKQFDTRTNVTIAEEGTSLVASILYTLPLKEGQILLETTDKNKLKLGIMSLCNRKLFASLHVMIPEKNKVSGAITEEKAANIYLKLIQQKDIDDETLQTLKDLFEEISSTDLLFYSMEVADQKLTPKQRDFVISDSLSKVDQKTLVEKINQDTEAKQMFLFHGLKEENTKDLHLSIPQIKAVAYKGYREILITALNDVSKYSNDAVESILEYLEYSSTDEALGYLKTVIDQDRISACADMLFQLLDDDGLVADQAIQVSKILKPIFKQILKTHMLSCILMVEKICNTLDEKDDDALALIKILNDNIKENATESGDPVYANHLLNICDYLTKVGIDYSIYDMFYLPFIHGGISITDGNDETHYILPPFIEGPYKDNIVKKLNALIEENKIKIDTLIFCDSTKFLITLIKDTPLWEKLWQHFDVDYDHFDVFFPLLNKEQQNEILDNDFMYNGNQYFTEILDMHSNNDSIQNKAIDIAIQELNEGNEYKVSYLVGFSNDIPKKLYDKIGLVDFIEAVDEDGAMDEIEDRLERAGVDITTIDYQKLADNEDVGPNFLYHMGQYKILYEMYPENFFKMLKGKSNPIEMCKVIGVNETLKVLSKEKISDDALQNLKPFFNETEAEISEKEFEILLTLYSKDAAFCQKLIDNLSDDELKHFMNSSNEALRGWALSEHNPKELLNIILNKKSVPSWFQLPMLVNIPPRSLREFIQKKIDNNLEDLANICYYIVRNLYPDEFYHSALAPYFYEATPEQKAHYVEVVGEDSLNDKDLEKLQGKRSRYERKQDVPKLPDQVVHDKLELLRLILPLAKPA